MDGNEHDNENSVMEIDTNSNATDENTEERTENANIETQSEGHQDGVVDEELANDEAALLAGRDNGCWIVIDGVEYIPEEPERKKRTVVEDESDGSSCPICLENWTNVGDHRLISLKCGHLFGLSCIQRWLSGPTKYCPTCKKKAVSRDIRFIYANKLIAMDATELDLLKHELEIVKEQKYLLDQEFSNTVLKNCKMRQQIEDLKLEVTRLTRALETQKQTNSVQQDHSNRNFSEECERVRLYMDKQLEINREGGCRVLDCQSSADLLIVSTKSNNPLFSGFGVKKITISSYKPTAFIPLHTMPVRDVCFQPQHQNFLTVGLDKAVKLVEGSTNVVVCSKMCSSPLWSCCWDAENINYFYIGEQQGSIIQYDIRNISEPVNIYLHSTDKSPVVSISSIPGNHMPLMQGGLMCCKLNGLYVFAKKGNDYELHWLPNVGPFICARFDSEEHQFLVSSRPNTSSPFSRHCLLNLDKDKDTNQLIGNTVHCFKGGALHKMLSRSAIVPGKEGKYVAAYEESHKSALLWSISSGRQVGSIPAHEPILDLCGLDYNKEKLLVSLTEKKLEFFKYS